MTWLEIEKNARTPHRFAVGVCVSYRGGNISAKRLFVIEHQRETAI